MGFVLGLLAVTAVMWRVRPGSSRGRARWFVARALLPKWRFFEQAGDVPRLYYRVRRPERASAHEFGPWQPALATPPRRARHFLLNPQGNNVMALNALLERFIEEAQDPSGSANISESVTIRLIERYVRLQLATSEEARPFQFKIAIFPSATDAESAGEDFLISHECGV